MANSKNKIEYMEGLPLNRYQRLSSNKPPNTVRINHGEGVSSVSFRIAKVKQERTTTTIIILSNNLESLLLCEFEIVIEI